MTTNEVRRDSSRIADAEKNLVIIREEQTRYDEFKAAMSERDELHARQQNEEELATRRVNHASSQYRQIGWSKREIGTLRREAPELFADGLIPES